MGFNFKIKNYCEQLYYAISRLVSHIVMLLLMVRLIIYDVVENI